MHLRNLCFLPLALLVGAAPALAQEADDAGVRIAYVNSQAVIQRAPGADSAQQAFQQEAQQLRQEAQRLSSEIDSLRQQYQQQQGMLSEAARQKRQEEIQQKQQELQQRVTQMEQQLSQRQQELLQPILNRVQQVIEELRVERGYDMVFDLSASGVVAADPSLNITQAVISRLQASSDTVGANAGGPGPGR